MTAHNEAIREKTIFPGLALPDTLYEEQLYLASSWKKVVAMDVDMLQVLIMFSSLRMCQAVEFFYVLSFDK